MDINKVIEMGKINVPLQYEWSSIAWWGWILISIILIIGILSFVICISVGEIDEGFKIFTASLAIIILPTFLVMSSDALTKQSNIENQRITQWKQEYVKPFIQSLPYEKHEIIYVKLDPEIKTDVSGSTIMSLFGGYGYIETTSVNLVPLVVAYKDDNQIKIYKNFANADMELSKDDIPYIQFKSLDKDLGHGIDRGQLNVRVFLPKDYKFDSIK